MATDCHKASSLDSTPTAILDCMNPPRRRHSTTHVFRRSHLLGVSFSQLGSCTSGASPNIASRTSQIKIRSSTMVDFGRATGGTAWHLSLTRRGRYHVLSEWCITLALCLWSAIHLNLLEHGKPRAHLCRSTLCVLMGGFEPELVVWAASKQNIEARTLLREVSRYIRFNAPPTSNNAKNAAVSKGTLETTQPRPQAAQHHQ